ncbi:unnamed protein product [Boreogadus saida]
MSRSRIVRSFVQSSFRFRQTQTLKGSWNLSRSSAADLILKVHHVNERTNERTNGRSASQRVVGLGGVMSPRVVFSSPRVSTQTIV